MSEDTTTNAPNLTDDLKKGMALQGTVKHIELFGALVDIGKEQDALLHISQLGQTNVRNVEDVVKVGDTITAFVLKIDNGRVALSMVKPPSVDWNELREGQILAGKAVRIEKFGVFVDIGAERPGMVHISELTDGFVRTPSEVVSVGDEVRVRVLKVNRKKRQIDLSMKFEEEAPDIPADDEEERVPTAMELAFRKAQERQGATKEAKRKAKEKSRADSEQDEIIARTLRQHTAK